MFETILMVGGVMLVCAIIFSPFVLWDLYKKKKRAKEPQPEVVEGQDKKEIIWWQALLCGAVLVSFFGYVVIKSASDFILPAIVAYPYYALCVWCLIYVSKKKIVWRKAIK